MSIDYKKIANEAKDILHEVGEIVSDWTVPFVGLAGIVIMSKASNDIKRTTENYYEKLIRKSLEYDIRSTEALEAIAYELSNRKDS